MTSFVALDSHAVIANPKGAAISWGARSIAGMAINRERYLPLSFFVDYNQHLVYLWVFH